MKGVDLGELICIAAAVLGAEPSSIRRAVKVGPAESALQAPFAGWGDFERYPEIGEKAAILCSRLVRNHPFPDGNKRTAYLTMIEFLERNDLRFDDSDQDEVAETIE